MRLSSCSRLFGFAALLSIIALPARADISANVQAIHDVAAITIHSGAPTTNADGYQFSSELTLGAGGNLYGVAPYGGVHGNGTIFVVTPAGALTVLHPFGTDHAAEGYDPEGALLKGTDGAFYGTTHFGGANGTGIIFKLATDGTVANTTFTKLFDFPEAFGVGSNPGGALIQDASGTFYGTTQDGGAFQYGTVFKFTTDGTPGGTDVQLVHAFGNGQDGTTPRGLLIAHDGVIYGTASGGGANNKGTIYAITPTTGYDSIYDFGSSAAVPGDYPHSAPVEATDPRVNYSTYYGTLADLNTAGATGGVFSFTSDGTRAGTNVNLVKGFTGSELGGFGPSQLLVGPDSQLYGTASGGGANGNGLIFQLTPAGTYTELYPFSHIDEDTFTNADGVAPGAGLTLGLSNTLYGTTINGGAHAIGTIFKVTSDSLIPPLAGTNVQFGAAELSGTEGDVVRVPVLRGTDSTGALIVYFTLGGTAIAPIAPEKNPDYTISDPPSNYVTFAEGDYAPKYINVKLTTNKVAEPDKNIELIIFRVVGQATLPNDPALLTADIQLHDHTPALLAAPGPLKVSPQNIVKPTVTFPKPPGVLAIARTFSEFLFSTSQNFPVTAPHKLIVVQTTSDATPSATSVWTQRAVLSPLRAGPAYSGQTATPPTGPHIWFRTYSTADGYPDKAGKPVGPYDIIGGPDINVQGTQSLAMAGPFFEGDLSVNLSQHIFYRFHVFAANGGDHTPAHHATLALQIPSHTTFVSVSDPANVTLKSKSGKVSDATWNLNTLNPGDTHDLVLEVVVDDAKGFDPKTSDPAKAYGKAIEQTKFGLSADEGIKNALINTRPLTAKVQAPLSLDITQTPNPDTDVKGGDVITYQLTATNNSAATIPGAVVRDRIPLGTILEAAYAPGSSMPLNNSSLTKGSNPALVYILLSDVKAVGLKKGAELDPATIPPALLNSLLDGNFIARELRWKLPDISAGNNFTVKFSVRVLYDINGHDLDSGGLSLSSIKNDDFDLTYPSGKKDALKHDILISALNGDTSPPVLSNDVDDSTPGSFPVIGLSKLALGDHDLVDASLTGNGHQHIPGFGDITTAIQNRGFDYALLYVNTGDAPATQVVIHDVIPPDVDFLGFISQSVNGANPTDVPAEQITFYDRKGVVIPVSAITGSNADAVVRTVGSMDIHISLNDANPLPAHSAGIFRYTVTPRVAPGAKISAHYASDPLRKILVATGEAATKQTFIYSFSGINPNLGPSDPNQGAYLNCADLQKTIPATPDEVIIKVVTDISADVQYRKTYFKLLPGYIFPYTFSITQNGDLDAVNCALNLVLPAGVEALNQATTPNPVTHLNQDTQPYFVNQQDQTTGTPLTITTSAKSAVVSLGQLSAHATTHVRVWFRVKTPLDPGLKSFGRVVFPVNPSVTGTRAATGAGPNLARFTAAAPAPVVLGTAKVPQPIAVSEGLQPVLGIARSSPYLVNFGGTLTYTIVFSNFGDVDATNVEIGMQVPYGAQQTAVFPIDAGVINKYVSASGKVIASGNDFTPKPVTTTLRTDATIKKGSGDGVDIVTWRFKTLPAHSAGAIKLQLNCFPAFFDDCIRDHSLYIKAANAPLCTLAPNPIGTWVQKKPFDISKWEVLGCFTEHLGLQHDASTHGILVDYVTRLDAASQVTAVGGLDGVHLKNGARILQLQSDQAIVMASERNAAGIGHLSITGPNASILVSGGGVTVASGDARSITISDVGGNVGARTASDLLDHAQDLVVAQALGNIIAANKGNMIDQDVDGKALQLSNHPAGAPVAIGAAAPGLVRANRGVDVTSSQGLIAVPGTPIISQDGSGIISDNSEGLIGQDGCGIIGQDGSGLITVSTGALVNKNGGPVISNDGGTIISRDTAGVISRDGAGVISNDGGTFQNK
ncbi:MAG TPA: choice-of-anchor tandem repeat GloVer-containing protein [Chthoniobacteraceae bacterium]|jgi:uncharacterized repeat protein (TIGR01451 family)|nr:choice-of-anchor tandem repeat GloVer-containing protein [Chthoniobacteraceae bacterium]